MTTHHLSSEHVVARPRSEVFAFLSRPDNLGRITSACMRFELASKRQNGRRDQRVVIEHARRTGARSKTSALRAVSAGSDSRLRPFVRLVVRSRLRCSGAVGRRTCVLLIEDDRDVGLPLDFVNQPALVDTAPLLARVPRRLTPLAEGVETYLGHAASGNR